MKWKTSELVHCSCVEIALNVCGVPQLLPGFDAFVLKTNWAEVHWKPCNSSRYLSRKWRWLLIRLYNNDVGCGQMRGTGYHQHQFEREFRVLLMFCEYLIIFMHLNGTRQSKHENWEFNKSQMSASHVHRDSTKEWSIRIFPSMCEHRIADCQDGKGGVLRASPYRFSCLVYIKNTHT